MHHGELEVGAGVHAGRHARSRRQAVGGDEVTATRLVGSFVGVAFFAAWVPFAHADTCASVERALRDPSAFVATMMWKAVTRHLPQRFAIARELHGASGDASTSP